MNLRKLRTSLTLLIEKEAAEFKDLVSRLSAQVDARGRGFGGEDLNDVTRATNEAIDKCNKRLIKAFDLIEVIDKKLGHFE